jgi:hypothetical protein
VSTFSSIRPAGESGQPRRSIRPFSERRHRVGALVARHRGQRPGLHDHQRHVVADCVVQLARDPQPLLVGRRLGRQLAFARRRFPPQPLKARPGDHARAQHDHRRRRDRVRGPQRLHEDDRHRGAHREAQVGAEEPQRDQREQQDGRERDARRDKHGEQDEGVAAADI